MRGRQSGSKATHKTPFVVGAVPILHLPTLSTLIDFLQAEKVLVSGDSCRFDKGNSTRPKWLSSAVFEPKMNDVYGYSYVIGNQKKGCWQKVCVLDLHLHRNASYLCVAI